MPELHDGARRLPQPRTRHLGRPRRHGDLQRIRPGRRAADPGAGRVAARGGSRSRTRRPTTTPGRSPRRPGSRSSASRSDRDGIASTRWTGRDADAAGADPVAPVADRRRAVGRVARRGAALGAATAARSSSRTTTTPSTATTGRRSAPCRAWRRTGSSTRARPARRSRPACGWAGWWCPGDLVDDVAAAKITADRGSPVIDQLDVRRLPRPAASSTGTCAACGRSTGGAATSSWTRCGDRTARTRAGRHRGRPAPRRLAAGRPRRGGGRRGGGAARAGRLRASARTAWPAGGPGGLIFGYSTLSERAITEGIGVLAEVIDEVRSGRALPIRRTDG